MPRRQILTKRQRAEIFGLPTDQAIIMKYYTLSEEDLKLIDDKRRVHNKFGFALQLCALRYPGRLIEPRELIPASILKYISKQIGLSPDDLVDYAIREETRYNHLAELRQEYRFCTFSNSANFRQWLNGRAKQAVSSEQLLIKFVEYCRTKSIILPGVSVIERLCADAMVAAERDAEALISGRLSVDLSAQLNALLEEQIDGRLTRFIWLRQFEAGGNSSDMNKLLDKLAFLQSLNLSLDLLADIPPHQITRLRRQGERYFAHGLKDISENRRLAILAVCAIEWQSAIADTIIETHDRIVGRTWREAQRACDDNLEASQQSIDQTLKGLGVIGQSLLSARDLQQSLEDAISWPEFETLVNTVINLTTITSASPIQFVAQGYHRFRRYVPRMLSLLEIKAAPIAQDLMGALESIRDGRPNGSPAFLKPSSKWRATLKDEGTDRLWEVAVLFHMREGFRSGDLWLAHSRRFGDWKQSLVPLPAVQTAPKIAIPNDPTLWISEQKEKLDQAFDNLAMAASKGSIPGGSIENGELRIGRLSAQAPDGAEELVSDLYQRLPDIRITDMLLEADADIGFTDAFRNLRTGAPCKDTIGLMNVILSEGLNLGLSKMAEASNSHEYWQLLRIATWHMDGEAINRALSMVIEAQSALPMAQFWGIGDSASSDGQFFASTRQGEAMNLINAKYSNTPGLKVYAHVSDQFGPFSTENIPATASEAPYILNGLLMNEAGRKIKEQFTDTGGVNDMIFATTMMLGYNFIPRIRDLPSRKLYAFEPAKVHTTLRPLIGGKIREQLIINNWDDILRLVATMSLGVAKPSDLLRKLASFPRQNELAFALREVGRMVRTQFITKWLLDPDMQRRAQIGLNKGEAHHALKNALRIGRQGEIRDRTSEAQHYRMAGLNLLTAIVIYWNTKHLGNAVKARKREGLSNDPSLLKHSSPLGWAHILLTGEYKWPKNP